jgi:hypothetical protein
MTKDELQALQDSAANRALRARERIETAVGAGELPVWVMEACAALERSSMLYGAMSAHLKQFNEMPATGAVLH